jgi:hypothetical protein
MVSQCAEIQTIALGRGSFLPNASQDRLKSLSSMVFIGEPWPINTAGIKLLIAYPVTDFPAIVTKIARHDLWQVHYT